MRRLLPFILILLFCVGCRTLQNVPDASPEAASKTVMLFGTAVLVDAERIVVSMPVPSFAALENALPQFLRLRAAEFVFPSDWNDDPESFLAYLAFRNAHPELHCTEQYPANAAPSEITELQLNQPIDAWDAYLSQFPALQTLTVSQTVSCKAIVSLIESDPALNVLWTDEAFGPSDSAVRELHLSGDPDPALLQTYLSCFPALETVDLRETSLSEEDGNALCDAYPDVVFLRTVTLNGLPADTGITEYNLDNAEIDFDAIMQALQYFPCLKHIEMNDCSLSDAQLAALRERYPEKGIVWTVHIRRYSIRTDSVAFSTQCGSGNPNPLTSQDVDSLRYCIDLIALDLGHNDITDLDFLRPLKNLQVLILADSRKLTDVSVIGTLSRLKYLELFLTNVSDVAPLASLSELLDVNLCITKVVDASPLLACKELERIWIGEQTQQFMTLKSLLLLQEAFPNAEFDLLSVSCTARGWREHPRYFAFREMFETNQPVEPFLPQSYGSASDRSGSGAS